MSKEEMQEQMKAYERQLNEQEVEEDDDVVPMPVFAKEATPENQIDEDKLPFGFDDSDEEKDDYTIKPTDCLFVAGKIEDEFSHLEVYVYEENKTNLYVHHDLLLSSFPICLEWCPVEPSSLVNAECDRANLAIVGTFLPDIEFWNLDILDTVEPHLILEGIGPNSMAAQFGTTPK